MTKRARFDAAGVMRSIKRGETAGLFKAGGFVRGIAQRSIVSSKAHAPPYSPPKQRRKRAGGNFSKSIAFIVNRAELSTDIGSAPDKKTTTPSTLEHGGVVKYRLIDIYNDAKHNGTANAFKRLQTRLKGVKRAELYRQRTAHQKPRPFMTAALKKFKDKAAEQFRNILQ